MKFVLSTLYSPTSLRCKTKQLWLSEGYAYFPNFKLSFQIYAYIILCMFQICDLITVIFNQSCFFIVIYSVIDFKVWVFFLWVSWFAWVYCSNGEMDFLIFVGELHSVISLFVLVKTMNSWYFETNLTRSHTPMWLCFFL